MPGYFLDSSDLLNDPPALRERAERDGYLFFRGLLPGADIFPVREDLLKVVERYGWLRKGGNRDLGRLRVRALSAVPQANMRTDIGVSRDAYHDVQKLESVHRLPHHPQLIRLYETLFGEKVLVHARHIIRMITPHPSVFPTPPHQDYPLIQGTARTWTCWIPIGDCPRSLGALKVLRRSHRLGYLPIGPAKGAGAIAAQLCPGEEDWVEGDFAAGDVLTFPAFTVHKALPCVYRDRLRLSFDVRYQPLSEPVEKRSLLPHCELTWEQVYEDWESNDLKYYWRDLPLMYSDWNAELMTYGRRIC